MNLCPRKVCVCVKWVRVVLGHSAHATSLCMPTQDVCQRVLTAWILEHLSSGPMRASALQCWLQYEIGVLNLINHIPSVSMDPPGNATRWDTWIRLKFCLHTMWPYYILLHITYIVTLWMGTQTVMLLHNYYYIPPTVYLEFCADVSTCSIFVPPHFKKQSYFHFKNEQNKAWCWSWRWCRPQGSRSAERCISQPLLTPY